MLVYEVEERLKVLKDEIEDRRGWKLERGHPELKELEESRIRSWRTEVGS